jgi:twitching motility protein PilJ
MFSNIRIGRRLLLLISVLTLIFITTGAVTLASILDMSNDTANLNETTSEAAEFTRISGSVRYHLVDVSQQLSRGALTWQEAAHLLDSGAKEFDNLWDEQVEWFAGNQKLEEFFNDAFGIEVNLVKQGFKVLSEIVQAENRGQLSLYLLNDASGYSAPFLNAADGFAALGEVEAQKIFDASESDARLYLIASVIVILVGLLLAATLGPVIYLSITSPIKNISGVVERVSKGELDARTELASKDEIGQLGNAFDSMLNERVSTLAKVEEENEKINDSVINLLEAVSDMSDRDLTVRVPVAEDVTGPVADAMNLMASETARVLNEIREIAGQVSEAASVVQTQGGRVTELADNERSIVEDTMGKLEESSKSMAQVAKLAHVCNETASRASSSTQEALETVAKTATGMNDIRETIAETEKRIKRLGERSQEINGAVEIINNIAERTHVLALNASMQAAAAGDAGRGFAVVADEVQRLAESSRQSTSEIAGLVNNIQSETAETMATMNKTISQVVEGTELAQAAGGQMESTQKTTAELANAVEQIAKRSLMQARISNGLREQAAQVQTSTQETSAELEQQSELTVKLVEYSGRLVDSVAVFKLPEAS